MDQMQQNKKGKNNAVYVMGAELAGILLGLSLLLLISNDGADFVDMYVDIPALVLIMLLTLPVFIGSGLWKDFLRAFVLNREEGAWKLVELKRTLEAVELIQKLLVYAACLIFMFQTVSVLYSMDVLSSLGPKLAMMLRSGVYVAVLELLLAPLKLETKKRIIDFMEEEPE